MLVTPLAQECPHCYVVVVVVFPQNGVPHVAKGLLWEPETPGPLPLLPPGPGKGLGAQGSLPSCSSCRFSPPPNPKWDT